MSKKPVDFNFANNSWFDLTPTPRKTQAGTYTGREITKTLNNNLFAGTNILNEEIELEKNLKTLLEEERDYITVENYLSSLGYQRMRIQKKFRELTGIDPIKTYLDVENFPKPPVTIPRYVYGWGSAKGSKDGVYYYIHPYALDLYAIWKQDGLERTMEKSFITLGEAKDELNKLVKEAKQSDPNTAAKDVEYQLDSRIVRKVGELQTPSNREEFKDIFDSIYITAGQLSTDERIIIVKQASDQGTITEDEKKWLVRYIEAEGEEEEEEQDQSLEDVKDEVDKYQTNIENRSVEEIENDISIPQEGFDNELEKDRQINMPELIQDSFAILDKVNQELTSYQINPIKQAVDTIHVEKKSDIDASHIDAGSVWFVVEIKNLGSGDIAKGAVMMYIKGGELQFPGKFKGSNGREYALMDAGISSYFDDLTGETLQSAEQEGAMKQPTIEEKSYSSFGFSK